VRNVSVSVRRRVNDHGASRFGTRNVPPCRSRAWAAWRAAARDSSASWRAPVRNQEMLTTTDRSSLRCSLGRWTETKRRMTKQAARALPFKRHAGAVGWRDSPARERQRERVCVCVSCCTRQGRLVSRQRVDVDGAMDGGRWMDRWMNGGWEHGGGCCRPSGTPGAVQACRAAVLPSSGSCRTRARKRHGSSRAAGGDGIGGVHASARRWCVMLRSYNGSSAPRLRTGDWAVRRPTPPALAI
jgi:hypothetical protein